MKSSEASAVSYQDLPGLLFMAAVDARNRKRALQLVEVDVDRFKIVSGTRCWGQDIRAYITAAGVVTESSYAANNGFRLPLLDPRVTVIRAK